MELGFHNHRSKVSPYQLSCNLTNIGLKHFYFRLTPLLLIGCNLTNIELKEPG